MNAELVGELNVVSDIVQRYGLSSLLPTLQACQALSREDTPLDVAVLGEFKSGKSSLLNALLGESVFPVGALPVTAIITRAAAGPESQARVTHLDGSAEEIVLDRIAEFVTETGNPDNRRQVAVVDVFTPAMKELPGVRLVDTPGLGSVFTHNTEVTHAWMPNVGVALVTISSDRPMSDEDRRLVAEALQTAPRVVVMLTKVDLLTAAELKEVTAFLERSLQEDFAEAISVLPFSCKSETDRWVHQLRECVLLPVAGNLTAARQAALCLKRDTLVRACRGYLGVGLQASERSDADRQRLRAAVLDESVNAAVLDDELRLAEQRMGEESRPAFEKVLLSQCLEVAQRLRDALRVEVRRWRGNLAIQTQRYEVWMRAILLAELTPLSREAGLLGVDLIARAEKRFRRIVEAFRDRLGRNIHEATGVTVSSAAWNVKRPQVELVPVAVSRAFMTDWTLLWWMLPMWLVGGLFRRHIQERVSWEVEKNLARLAGDWASAVTVEIADLRTQAVAWVNVELATLNRLLGQRPVEATAFRESLQRLEELESGRLCEPAFCNRARSPERWTLPS